MYEHQGGVTSGGIRGGLGWAVARPINLQLVYWFAVDLL